MSLTSPWSEQLDYQNILSNYPRMDFQRDNFLMLNGEWEFQINDGRMPSKTEGWETILVPFALGSKLSGTNKQLQPNETLWYRRSFTCDIPSHRAFLNFEEVDQCCTVYLNGLEVGSHEGGYSPFSLDVSDFLKQHNEVIVKVTDKSDQGKYAYGKQKIEHGGMWYTPSSGIWQSVWLEMVPERTLYDLKITPDYDKGQVHLKFVGNYTNIIITVYENNKIVYRNETSMKNHTIELGDNFHPWTCEDPFLYDLTLETDSEMIRSYFGMRTFTKEKDHKGIVRFCLNHKPLFLTGLLDQGYTVDGLMTYPSEEAMEYEIRKIKEMGFNMLRKHVKQESRRWYYLCDKYGILVMQDMPNGGGPYNFGFVAVLPTIGLKTYKDNHYKTFGRPDEEGRITYYKELDELLNSLYNYTSIFAWVPFNEGWGQFDSVKVTAHIKEFDSTRLVDSASGWYDQKAGDFNSIHRYFTKFRVPRLDNRILLLSEFGGYSFLEWGHSEAEKLYGYKKFTDRVRLDEAIDQLYQREIIANIPKGLSGCIYTQVSDVEDECNGLFTADRRIIKIHEKKMLKNNLECIRSL
ncbi:MAG: glycoside hydrolase family 2 [Solobacterium sp.]|nr:glycoside hydrolase family 2 [Solobacterium sp.]